METAFILIPRSLESSHQLPMSSTYLIAKDCPLAFSQDILLEDELRCNLLPCLWVSKQLIWICNWHQLFLRDILTAWVLAETCYNRRVSSITSGFLVNDCILYWSHGTSGQWDKTWWCFNTSSTTDGKHDPVFSCWGLLSSCQRLSDHWTTISFIFGSGKTSTGLSSHEPRKRGQQVCVEIQSVSNQGTGSQRIDTWDSLTCWRTCLRRRNCLHLRREIRFLYSKWQRRSPDSLPKDRLPLHSWCRSLPPCREAEGVLEHPDFVSPDNSTKGNNDFLN